MSDLAAYLEAEFHRYFPEASISVTEADEVVTVHVDMALVEYEFDAELGSDDDWYKFIDPNGILITVPLMPESDQ